MKIRKIGIAGCGMMGSSMARIFAEYGYKVTLYNHKQPRLDEVREDMGPELSGKIFFTTDLKQLADNDLIIENIPEQMELKQDFYRSISDLVSDDTIVATNSSGLSINKLSEAMKLPERFLGYHWVNPPHLMQLTEIIKNEHTREDVARELYELSLSIDKKPVLINKDLPGFCMNRIQFAVIREALHLVEQGVVSVEDMDNVVKYGIGLHWAALGPLETIDFGGFETFFKISEYMYPALSDTHKASGLFLDLVSQGCQGIRNGRGFYEYPEEERKERLQARDEMLEKLIAVRREADKKRSAK